MAKGIFTISLDFELYWGVRDHRTLEQYGENIRQVHHVVPRLLRLFEHYGIHCTWATVGFLFFKNKEELMAHLPALLPDYQEERYDPYRYLQQHHLDPVYHFAPELIQQIRNTPGQEIATHTFSHFYTLEKNTTIEQFRADLQTALDLARKKNMEITSIVFPRNQYTEEHIRVCKTCGIKVYRGNEHTGIYQPVSRQNENLFRRAVRFADAYLNITGHHVYPLPAPSALINIPASRFLRPYKKTLKLLERLKFARIKESMEVAAQQAKLFHLWWHPHNFGRYTEENFIFLEKVLEVYRSLNLAQKMESQNLAEIYSKINASDA
jgi:peptidoglycan/xylan/chitin deacetylase (PgdA/CDA1 family)